MTFAVLRVYNDEVGGIVAALTLALMSSLTFSFTRDGIVSLD